MQVFINLGDCPERSRDFKHDGPPPFLLISSQFLSLPLKDVKAFDYEKLLRERQQLFFSGFPFFAGPDYRSHFEAMAIKSSIRIMVLPAICCPTPGVLSPVFTLNPGPGSKQLQGSP